MLLKTYLIALIIFLVLDMVWLGFVAKKFYSKHIGYLLAQKVNWVAAIIFYLLFILGLVVFIINPALAIDSGWKYALKMGALFGVITYATYDLTNQATIKDWPLVVTLVDLVWGGVLAASVSALVVLALS